MRGQLVVVSAPSGAGKTTIIEQVRDRMGPIGYSVSHTTRKPRQGEKDGVHYHFVSVEAFESMIKEGAFVEWAKVYGHYYGTSRKALEEGIQKGVDILLDLDPVGAKNIKKQFPEAILIFIVPPSLAILEERLRNRGTDSQEVVAQRLERAREEVSEAAYYDYIVVNDDLEDAVADVMAIIRAGRCRKILRLPYLKEQFNMPTIADGKKG